MNAGRWKRKTLLEGFSAFGRPACALAAPLQRPMPHPGHSPLELTQRAVVGWHSVVAVMSFEHLAQPGMLLHYWVVPTASGFFLQAREFRAPFLP